MDKARQHQLLNDLRKEESEILSELSTFAKPDPHVEGGFTVPFPNEGTGVDENAREIEEFERLNVLKNNLVKRLQDIRATIKKIKEGLYGQCEKCLAAIQENRLKVMPAARFCMNCARQGVRET